MSHDNSHGSIFQENSVEYNKLKLVEEFFAKFYKFETENRKDVLNLFLGRLGLDMKTFVKDVLNPSEENTPLETVYHALRHLRKMVCNEHTNVHRITREHEVNDIWHENSQILWKIRNRYSVQLAKRHQDQINKELKQKQHEERVNVEIQMEEWFGGMLLPRLKEECKKFGLKRSGTKAEILQRLADMKRKQMRAQGILEESELEKCKVPSLLGLAAKSSALYVHKVCSTQESMEAPTKKRKLDPQLEGQVDPCPVSDQFVLPEGLNELVARCMGEKNLLSGCAMLALGLVPHFHTVPFHLARLPNPSIYFPRLFPNAVIHFVHPNISIDELFPCECGETNELHNQRHQQYLRSHKSFEDAIKQCEDNDVILLTPGVYQCDAIPIAKNIEVIGVGSNEQVIISNKFAFHPPCIIKTASVRFHNLTLMNTDKRFLTLVVEETSFVELNDCLVFGYCISICKSASAIIQHCKLTSEGTSIRIESNANEVIVNSTEIQDKFLTERKAAVEVIATVRNYFHKLDSRITHKEPIEECSVTVQLTNNNLGYCGGHAVGIVTDSLEELDHREENLALFNKLESQITLQNNQFTRLSTSNPKGQSILENHLVNHLERQLHEI